MTVHPADAPVGGALYGTDALRACLGERAALARMLEFEASLARVQAAFGLVPADAAEAIAAAADVDRLDLAALKAATRNTGYPVVGLVKQLSALAGPEAGRWTHWGATTQDVLDTALVLQLRDALALLEADLHGTIAGLAALARTHRGTVMAGRTHLQHALPTTFGLKCAVWLAPLLDMRDRLAQLRPRVLRVQFGGAAGTLASLGADGPAVRAALAQALDLYEPATAWHATRDGLAEVACWCGLLCGALAKLATDVILLMQTEVAEVAEPHAPGRGGSSTMPQKRNPIACEYILAQARLVHALVPVMLGAMAADHERATGPWQAEPLALPQALLLTGGALATARGLAKGLTVDAGRMRRNLDLTGGLIVAEAAMMGLAPALGRERAHAVVHHACDAALAEGLPLADALWREEAVRAQLDRAALDRLVAPAAYLGAAKDDVDRVLARV